MKIVIGLGFGDEGKGSVTSYLCSTVNNPIVVRFNGGHQAGHTVIRDGKRHVFSTYGSGTLQGAPTYWSKFCTFYPVAVCNERAVLEKVLAPSKVPTIYVHPFAPVTTPFDVYKNQEKERVNRHGSVGVGFGETINRHESFYKLHVIDLFFPKVLRAKLENIATKYYQIDKNTAHIEIEKFLEYCYECLKYISVSNEADILIGRDLIFEGAQGILLDQDFGFFPNVTRSNTTSKNAISIIDSLGLDKDFLEIFYVTRSYQTRHGNGYMSFENDNSVVLKNNSDETNVKHEFQGNFRIGKLDTELLSYALNCDSHFTEGVLRKNLVVTCLDQHRIDPRELATKLRNISGLYASESPDSSSIFRLA